VSDDQQPVKSFKGFDQNLQCRGFQYAVGETFEHKGTVEACAGGFHACEYPLDVLRYYPPASSRFFTVEQSGEISRHDEDTKVASSKIKIGVELNLAGLIKAAIEYTTSRCKPIDPESPAWSTSENGAATASGYSGAATASGNSGAATASGNSGAATASGDSGAATAEGRHSVALASGFDGKARGIEGAALFLVYRDSEPNDEAYGQILHAKAVIVGQDGTKPMVFYALNSAGEIVEAT
jgi:hypothetical protein